MSSPTPVLNAAVLNVIRTEAFRAWRSLRRLGYEHRDIRQDFALHLLDRADQYDAGRSAATTFASRVCRSRTIHILEAGAAAKRNGGRRDVSLSNPVSNEEGSYAELRELISDDEYMMRTGRQTRPAAELLSLRLDLDRILGTMPADLAQIAELLAAGEPVTEIAARLEISRTKLYRRIDALRSILSRSGVIDSNEVA